MRLIPRSRGGMLLRSLLAAVLVIGFSAATTAVAGLLQVRQITQYFDATPAFHSSPSVSIPNPGSPQTLLLVGSDHRAGTPWSSANTDTMMLVRLDPSSSTINLLSVPRDLKVQIPEGGVPVTDRLNAAYSIGGPNLLVKILQEQVFQGVKINHIIDINFGGFEQLINAIGCVYTDVDHRYYNNTAVTDYSSIDVQPGYQKLCGADALSFVRFRHSDSDIVRNARQQDFIRWAKSQFSQDQIVSERDVLLKIFGVHAQTDHNLHTTDGLINLFDLVAFSAVHSIKQVPFPAVPLPCNPAPAQGNAAAAQSPCYVTADPGAEQGAFHQFMTPSKPQPAPAAGSASASAGASSSAAAGGSASPSAGGAGGHGGSSSKQGPGNAASAPGLTADVGDGVGQANALGPLGIPIYFPKLIRAGSSYCSSNTNACPLETASPGSYPRAYLLHDRQGIAHYAYRMTLVMNPSLGQYYGVQGTTWQDPPILSSPSGTRLAGGRQLLLYANGGRLTLVAWRTPQGVYWISNTLTDDLSNQQMIAIAASLTPAGGK
ncbi:MAG: LCP family protein [Solirubrobacterales bacterium]|nr:LCP family protein [Solirubrobacterales bacterium]